MLMLIAQDVLNVRGYKFDHSENSQCHENLSNNGQTWQQNDKIDMLDFPVFAAPKCS